MSNTNEEQNKKPEKPLKVRLAEAKKYAKRLHGQGKDNNEIRDKIGPKYNLSVIQATSIVTAIAMGHTDEDA
jgi:hypothetical protein